MADVITWSKINKLKRAINGWIHVRGKITSAKDKMCVGLPAENMINFDAISTDGGIEVSYSSGLSSLNVKTNRTKGVMVRYSDKGYPRTKEQGVLAFNDEDIFEVTQEGQLKSKLKKQELIGFTKNTTYYFTAFPYTDGNVYNEQLGTTNTVSCKYVGSLGNLIVDVNADIMVRPLGYTITLNGGGKTYTQQGVGQNGFVFKLLKPATYTLTVSAVNGYNTPSSQTVKITSGVTNNLTVKYINNVTFDNATWDEIDSVAQKDKAKTVFHIGDSKQITYMGETFNVRIIGFDHDDLATGGKAKITCDIDHAVNKTLPMHNQDGLVGGYGTTDLYKWLESSGYNALPNELKKVVKTVNKKYGTGATNTALGVAKCRLFPFCPEEFGINFNETDSKIAPHEGRQYPFYTNWKRYKDAKTYWLRSIVVESRWYAKYYLVYYPGPYGTKPEPTVDTEMMGVTGATHPFYIRFGFCI